MGTPRTIEKKCYIVDTDPDGSYRLEFQMMPDGITDSKSVNWNHIEIVGRSHPILGYSSSGPRTWSINLTFFASPSAGDNTTASTIQKHCKFLLSLAYPDYKSGVKPPHKVRLSLGNQVNATAVCSDVSINYKGLSLDGEWPVYAEASITLIEADEKPINYTVIRG